MKLETDLDAIHGYVPCPECVTERRRPVRVIACPASGPGTRCFGYTGIHWTYVPAAHHTPRAEGAPDQ